MQTLPEDKHVGTQNEYRHSTKHEHIFMFDHIALVHIWMFIYSQLTSILIQIFITYLHFW